jgi:GrpB-like predicted nucleotidyltransferase (UPF0157 family)
MSKEPVNHLPLTGEQIRVKTVGEMRPFSEKVLIVDYDPAWPDLFRREAARVCNVLGPRALQIEHTGSTSVPSLAAKPMIDMLLVVKDSADENAYVSDLQGAGYTLRIRESAWHEHRMLKGPDTDINLHVFSSGCPEIERILLFRDWLRENAADRARYARTKLALAQRDWKYVQNYADAKTGVIEEVLRRARTMRGIDS